jgi:hypothetical protein
MEGQIWDAVLQRLQDEGPEAGPVVVLSNDEVLSPSDADFGEFTIVEATAEERETLKQTGYSMPDWTPPQESGCGECHAEQTEGGGLPGRQ